MLQRDGAGPNGVQKPSRNPGTRSSDETHARPFDGFQRWSWVYLAREWTGGFRVESWTPSWDARGQYGAKHSFGATGL